MIYRTRAIKAAFCAASLAILALLAAGCGPVNVSQIKEQKDASQMTAAEVLDLVEGNTLFLHSFNQDAYFYFDASGRLFGKDIDDYEDTGQWDVTEGGEVCMKMKWWWYGDLRCFPVYSGQGAYYLINSSGVIEFRAEQFPGDRKSLYYAEKDSEKKSYRRSARSETAERRSIRDRNAQTTAQQAVAAEQQPAGEHREISDEPMVPPVSDQELKNTVQWMARDCPGCNLANTNLRKAELVGAKLQGANLAGADLGMANLRRADLQGANLEDADLSYANLPGADLRNAVLVNADLKGANLIRADLTGAETEGANFEDALLEGAVGLE